MLLPPSAAGVDPDEPASPTKPHAHVAAEPDEHERHQLAGFKSVLARADTSAEAKEHARRETERASPPFCARRSASDARSAQLLGR